MNRSDLLYRAAAFGVLAAGVPSKIAASNAQAERPISPLQPPADGVPVAFLISDNLVMIDFAGPWEVFQDAHVTGRTQPAFNLFTVAETKKPIVTSGGGTLVPRYSVDDAPAPKVVVVAAQSNPSPRIKHWLVSIAKQADLVMSVCTGAFVLAQAGLLDGLATTTHHSSFSTLAMQYPNVTVKRGVRFVDDGHIATSAGLSAGIDLALHVVARYYGKESAQQTAYDMEYQSNSWLDGNNAAYLKPQLAHAGNAICPVCWMEIDPKTSPTLTLGGTRYFFCMEQHKAAFAAAPARFLT
jgi:transcriptional regulator GlxA family with amidase domain/YHS domain-containing protein